MVAKALTGMMALTCMIPAEPHVVQPIMEPFQRQQGNLLERLPTALAAKDKTVGNYSVIHWPDGMAEIARRHSKERITVQPNKRTFKEAEFCSEDELEEATEYGIKDAWEMECEIILEANIFLKKL